MRDEGGSVSPDVSSVYRITLKSISTYVEISTLSPCFRIDFQIEFLHEQLPLPVPCYDLVLVIEFTVGPHNGLLSTPNFPDLTGGILCCIVLLLYFQTSRGKRFSRTLAISIGSRFFAKSAHFASNFSNLLQPAWLKMFFVQNHRDNCFESFIHLTLFGLGRILIEKWKEVIP